jgi:hypothetical protein
MQKSYSLLASGIGGSAGFLPVSLNCSVVPLKGKKGLQPFFEVDLFAGSQP